MTREAKTLIVDDSSMALLMTSFMLKKCGVEEITEATDGLQGLEAFASALRQGAPYSLVFLDIMMPQLSGQEALKRMRALEKEAGVSQSTIIMATALHSTTDMIDALIEGDCSDYLVKPFKAEDVRALLVKHGFVEQS